jgi:hypothetical protein
MMPHKQAIIAIQFIFIFFACIASRSNAQGSENEKAVKAYYSGFETHNWNLVVKQFAEGFTFTTPINDHISAKEFKDSCWGTNKYIKKVNFIKMVESGNDVILLVEINTTDNKVVRNVDIYTFNAGKIKSIEVFFGPGESYPGHKN